MEAAFSDCINLDVKTTLDDEHEDFDILVRLNNFLLLTNAMRLADYIVYNLFELNARTLQYCSNQ